jgi:hypothetical protein
MFPQYRPLSGWLVLFLLMIPVQMGWAQSYDQYFTQSTMRVDYFHHGTALDETISLDSVVKEGKWPGSRTHLTDSPDQGKYRFVVLDDASGTAIFEGGYATLFGEWQTTGEAKTMNRTFHESVRFPHPKEKVKLQIHSREPSGKMKLVFELTVDPRSHRSRKWMPQKAVETVTMHQSGAPATTLDVVILADGYTRDQAEKARRDLKRYSDIFLASEPFAGYSRRISVRGVIRHTDYSGPNEPRKGRFGNSPLGTSFNTFDSARYLTTLENRELRDLSAHVPYDAIFIMVNSSRYGGAGIYNFFSIFVSDNEYDEYVFVHEFGHGFAGLADEYYTSSVAYSDFYPRGVEPAEPNITALLDGADGLKWKDQVAPGVPVPTPPEAGYMESVGAFEGAGYSAKGLYRPAFDCKMKSKRHQDFCPVCARAVEKTILLFVE